MNEIPQIVYERLRAGLTAPPLDGSAAERAHPDANLLTAFAEQVLSPKEHESVLDHLALCGDCREALALASPAADLAAPAIPAKEISAKLIHQKDDRNWLDAFRFGWPTLRWAALAAGVAVAAAVLLVHPGKLNRATQSSANRQIASPVPANSVARMSPPSPAQSPILTQTDEARSKPEFRLSKKLSPEPPVSRARDADSEMLATGAKKKAAGKYDKLSAAPSAGAAAFDAASSRGATETVEVSASVPPPTTESYAVNELVARSETPASEKAKQAPQTETSQLQITASAAAIQLPVEGRNVMLAAKAGSSASRKLTRPVAWAITTGLLQRSLDSGQTWQQVLRADHPLLCYASYGDDVWAGGQAGTLFHSADNGTTWAQVQPSIQGQRLSSDITHVDVSQMDVGGPSKIVVSTSNEEIWSSADDGKTWDKK